ncbi:hypothetical protein BKA25_002606 [Actinoalloteichus hymeniacidonis]|nr:hypothetical protein [Actinoalloteichus hymeniacidonis]
MNVIFWKALGEVKGLTCRKSGLVDVRWMEIAVRHELDAT